MGIGSRSRVLRVVPTPMLLRLALLAVALWGCGSSGPRAPFDGGADQGQDLGTAELPPPNRCGNTLLDDDEACDDGDQLAGDGCAEDCALEEGWECPVPGLACVPAACGDGIRARSGSFGEGCDDGGTESGDGCSPTCEVEPGWVCDGFGTCRLTTCGDGVREGSESCDDGNDDPFDGCGGCLVLPVCRDGACPAECGDGLVFPGEPCDDGNLRDGDGCSSSCTLEAGWACEALAEEVGEELAVRAVFRDFILNPARGAEAFGHPDFTDTLATVGISRGMVAERLGEDGLPVYTGRCTKGSAHPDACQAVGATRSHSPGEELFRQWYARRDPAIEIPRELLFRESRVRPGPFTFARPSGGFFPVDDQSWFATTDAPSTPGRRRPHPLCSPSAARYWFTFEGGETLTFGGDDDVWVFVGSALALDLGGLHPRLEATITLGADGVATCRGACVEERRDLGLVPGQLYEIALFHAERRGCESNFRIDLDGFDRIRSACAEVCGDGILTPGEQCDDGNDVDTDGCANDCTFNII